MIKRDERCFHEVQTSASLFLLVKLLDRTNVCATADTCSCWMYLS